MVQSSYLILFSSIDFGQIGGLLDSFDYRLFDIISNFAFDDANTLSCTFSVVF